jgi:hypothetical protein
VSFPQHHCLARLGCRSIPSQFLGAAARSVLLVKREDFLCGGTVMEKVP